VIVAESSPSFWECPSTCGLYLSLKRRWMCNVMVDDDGVLEISTSPRRSWGALTLLRECPTLIARMPKIGWRTIIKLSEFIENLISTWKMQILWGPWKSSFLGECLPNVDFFFKRNFFLKGFFWVDKFQKKLKVARFYTKFQWVAKHIKWCLIFKF
jgi:hypothetical protein